MIRSCSALSASLCLALAFIFLVYDGTKSIADRQFYHQQRRRSSGRTCIQNSLVGLQPLVQRYLRAVVLGNAFQPYFLDQPVWLVLGIVGAC